MLGDCPARDLEDPVINLPYRRLSDMLKYNVLDGRSRGLLATPGYVLFNRFAALPHTAAATWAAVTRLDCRARENLDPIL